MILCVQPCVVNSLRCNQVVGLLARLGLRLKDGEAQVVVREMAADGDADSVGFGQFVAWTRRVLALCEQPTAPEGGDQDAWQEDGSVAGSVAWQKRRADQAAADGGGGGGDAQRLLRLKRSQAGLAREFGLYARAGELFSACVVLDDSEAANAGPLQLAADLYSQQEVYVRFRVAPADGSSGLAMAERLLQRGLRVLQGGSAASGAAETAGGVLQGAAAARQRSACLHGLAFATFFSGRHDEATGHFEAAIALRREANDLKNLADSLNGLGSVHEKRALAAEGSEACGSLFAQAEAAFLESLQLRLKVLPACSADVGQVATSLGSLCLNQAKHARALEYYCQARACYTASLGAQHVRGVENWDINSALGFFCASQRAKRVLTAVLGLPG